MSEPLSPALASQIITRLCSLQRPHTLGVVISSPGSIGGTPVVPVESISGGIDWDMGKVLIHPATPLTTLSVDDLAAIKKSVRLGQSWHAYQGSVKLAAEIKALTAEVADLKRQLAAAKKSP